MVEIKGSVVGDAMKIIKTNYGEDVYGRVLDKLKPQTRAIFDTDSFVLKNWYPLEAFNEFLDADLKVTANGNEQELIRRSEELIEKQMSVIYKVFVKLGSPKFVLERIAAINQTYFREVGVSISFPTTTSAIVRLTGFEKSHRLIGLSIIGFYRKALDVSGAKNIVTKYLTPIEAEKGFSELSISWTDK